MIPSPAFRVGAAALLVLALHVPLVAASAPSATPLRHDVVGAAPLPVDSGGRAVARPPAARLLPRPAVLGASAAALAGAFALDREVREEWYTERSVGLSGAASLGNHLGNPTYALPVLAGLWGIGRLEHDAALSRAAERTVEGLLAAGVVDGAMKAAIGRARPNTGYGPGVFRPITLDDRWESFPSGHTAVAFSLATAAAEESHRRWVGVLAYGTAGMVGWARIYTDHHWASDVVGGALVGTITTRAMLLWLDRRERSASVGAHLSLVPGGAVLVIPTR